MSDKKPSKKKDKGSTKTKTSQGKKSATTKDSTTSNSPKSKKESTATAKVKDSKKDSKGADDSAKGKGTKKDAKGKGEKKDAKGKGEKKDAKGKGKKKDSVKKSSKKSEQPSIELGRARELLDDGGSGDSEYRVLVDRLWPRGIKKERLAHDAWDKDIAPSPDLRKAFHDGDLDFKKFRKHYLRELSGSGAPQKLLEAAADAKAKRIVLVYAAKDSEHNHARVLREALEDLAG